VESAEVLAAEVHKMCLEALGIASATPRNDPSIPLGKICNLTTDTASVMSRTAAILSQDYKLFRGMQWTPCSCHVLNLYLVDQSTNFRSIKALISRGSLIVTLFRNSAPRKLLQSCFTQPLRFACVLRRDCCFLAEQSSSTSVTCAHNHPDVM
jgi:hypothetical protein